MSTDYLPPVHPGLAGWEPGHQWPGGGAPAYPGEQGPGPGGDGGGRRRRRRVLAAVTAAAVLGAGAAAGTAWATGRAPAVLTTAQITERVSPALVNINTTLGYAHGTAAGTGIVLTSTGEVLTNNHVIQGATSITATDVGNGRTYQARVTGYDARHDIAVLRLQGASGLKTATLGNSASVRVGQRVVALGNAGGKGGAPSVVTGKVTGVGQAITAADSASGTSENLTGLIRTNAAIRAGDSGGPLVNTAGQVIGMNTAGTTSDSPSFQLPSQARTQTQAYAIPVSQAHATTDKIEAGQSSATIHLGATAFLGVGLTTAHSFGATVTQVVTVVPGSPAATAGLVPGDVLQSLGGHQVRSQEEVRSVLTRYHPGDRITVSWTGQSGQAHRAAVVLATGPAG